MSYVNNKRIEKRALEVTRELPAIQKYKTARAWQWRKNTYAKVWDFHHKQLSKELRDWPYIWA